MSGNFLLDTNILIALFNKDADVIKSLQKQAKTFIPSIVLGELFYGAYNSINISENITRIENLASTGMIIPCDEITAKVYGDIKARLKKDGTMIPENDIWIAAIAIQHGMSIVSRDKHFGRIHGIT